jgi:S-adenosylmethionine hydrolase
MPTRKPPVLAFLTDFGEEDAYVASMKGVALGICPRARLVDVTHAVAPGDLLGAAMVLDDARRWLPEGTVFVVVVDPGVGTERRALAARAGGRFFVGPDNGVLWPALAADARARVREIRSPRFRLKSVSDTFHGRDLFAPAAAALAAGRRLEAAGPAAADPARLEGFFPERRGARLEGRVLRVDRFGNLVTSVRAEDLEAAFGSVPFPTLDIRLGGRLVDETARTYGLARAGVPFALLGSGGRLEVALRDGSAAAALSARRGDPVTVERRGGRR